MTSADTRAPTMSAIVQDRYGTAGVLERRQVGRPDIGDTEVLIQVIAAGVNPADWAIMSGLPYITYLPEPNTPSRPVR